jgi:hypothetical protein
MPIRALYPEGLGDRTGLHVPPTSRRDRPLGGGRSRIQGRVVSTPAAGAEVAAR